jgi:hypothetical protein|tara:strand:+ start:10516 stop:10698 length:183 start_codon:yes stop_codon:yes gene_type:complete
MLLALIFHSGSPTRSLIGLGIGARHADQAEGRDHDDSNDSRMKRQRSGSGEQNWVLPVRE